jgi:hypothetical protein
MCLTTTGRRTGKKRCAILGDFDDGRNLVALARSGCRLTCGTEE